MSNVMNRKMFRPRNARNKLNQMGGIMASSPELINTVSTYRRGGPILGPTSPVQASRSPTGPRFSGGQNPNYGLGMIGYGLRGYQPEISSSDFMALPVSDQRKFIEAENRRRALQRPASVAQLPFRGIVDLISNAGAGIGNLVTSGAQSIGYLDPTADLSISGTDLTSSGVDLMQKFPELKGTEEEQVDQYAALLATDRGELQDPNIMRAVDEQAVKMQALEDQREKEGDIMSQYPSRGVRVPFTTDLGGEEAELGMPTSGEETKRATREGDGAARDKGLAPMAASDPQMVAARKGELGVEAQVKSIINTGTKEEQEKSLEQLMSEFTGAAPEYEGMDKGLAIAKIGFAMASGQSPSALTNIASALEQGADMFLKDKKDRDAFNRQVKLSALQYGLGEIGKQRAQDRLDKRTFREYVASKDVEYNGQLYKAGENILVSQEDILANDGRIPSGLADKAVYAAGIKASADKQKAFTDAVKKLGEEGVLEDSAATKITENYGSAVSNFQSAEVGVQLLENAILDVADGKVTGFANGFQSAMNKVAVAAGIDLGEKFDDVDQFKATLRRAFQKLIPTTLGEAQSANSISNRDVEFLADAYINAGALQNGVFSLAFVDETVLTGQLQGAIGEFRKSQRSSLDQMTTLEGRLYGRTLPGTRAPAATLVDPYRQSMSPYTPGQTGTSVGLVKGDDGIFRLQ